MSESIADMVVRLGKNTYLDRRIGGVHPSGEWKWQYRCECGMWCWEDWKHCPTCGKAVVKKQGEVYGEKK